jgi:hypothetical protein
VVVCTWKYSAARCCAGMALIVRPCGSRGPRYDRRRPAHR